MKMAAKLLKSGHSLAYYAKIAGFFGFFYFLYMLTFLTIANQGALVLGPQNIIAVYQISNLCYMAGFLLFTASRRLFAGQTARKIVLLIFGLAYTLGLGVVLFFNGYGFIAGAYLCTLAFGHMHGWVCYDIAMALQDGHYIGRVTGCALFMGTLLQVVTQKMIPPNITLLLVLVIALILMLYAIIKPPKDWVFDEPLPFEKDNRKRNRDLAVLAVAVILITVIGALRDGYVVTQHVEGNLTAASLLRLCSGAYMLALGFLFDWKRRAYMPIIVLGMTSLIFLEIIFVEIPGMYSFDMLLTYMWSNPGIVFMYVSFFDIAPKAKRPYLWAGMGRALDAGVAGSIGLLSFHIAGYKTMMFASAACLIGLLLTFWRSGRLSIIEYRPAAPDTDELSVERFSLKYGLTPRETEVMEKILESDKNVKELALELFISERVLYRYLNSLYEKTATASRMGLVLLYYGNHTLSNQEEQN